MNIRLTRLALVTPAFFLAALTTATVLEPAQTPFQDVTETRSARALSWQPSFAWDEAYVTVSGPPGETSWTVPGGATLFIAVDDLEVWALLTASEHDGQYSYEIRFAPVIDPARRSELDQLRSETGGDVPLSVQVTVLPVASGTFRVENGAIVGSESGTAEDTEPVPQDQYVADDMIVDGSLCVGNDCLNGENFGFDTVRLKENNLRIHFDDTSTISSYPRNDWRLIVNDSTDGGGNYFSIEDSTGARRVFTVEAGAPAHSLYVDSHGDIGVNTSVPYYEIHIVDGDSPTVRLDQDGSYGWTPQKWDITGNESNFFIRDATHASRLPFRIEPGSPTNTLFLRSNGNVGIGTGAPASNLEIETTGTDAELRLDRTDSGAAWVMAAKGDRTFTIGLPDGGGTFLTLHSTGALSADGPVNGLSDRNAKQGFAPVDRASLLGRLAALDIAEWSYISEGPGVRHVGPTAQDFRAAFGLGDDDTHISLSDLSGVALAAIQELHLRLQQRDREIAELRRRLEALEAAAGQTR